MAIKNIDGKPYQLDRPNPLVNLNTRGNWREDELQFQNWDTFAPAQKGWTQPAIVITPSKPTTVNPAPFKILPSAPVVTPSTESVLVAAPPVASEEDFNFQPGMFLYFYQLEGMYDPLYGEQRRGSQFREKPISIRVLGEEGEAIKFEKQSFIDGGIKKPRPGSRILDNRTGDKYRVISCSIPEGVPWVLLEIERDELRRA